MTKLTGKLALVTGAARGIGAGIALALADQGADVVITYERSTERAAAVVKAIEQKGRRAFAIQADSADAAAVKRSVDEAAAMLGGLDILVNNAGIARVSAFVNLGLADIDAMLNVNVRAAVLAAQAALPYLKQGGRIVTIGSNVSQRVPFGGLTVYALTKSALLAFTQGLAREVGPLGITVNLVQPGPIDTDLNPANGDLAGLNLPFIALGRYGIPADIGHAVAFLASSAANYVTGSVLTVDGGFNA
ncbi:SDR family oxidoreductase [Sodalis sp. C49]|uniref:SDR family oxidoreductase n=1 Tax=unclassified Sodalis (in: enterobacteria) TaxID=2636512 RepID=UPI003965CF24